MLKICDGCEKDFDIFAEGYASEDYGFALCGACWKIESGHRKSGGVF